MQMTVSYAPVLERAEDPVSVNIAKSLDDLVKESRLSPCQMNMFRPDRTTIHKNNIFFFM